MRSVVFDSHAVLRFAQDEAGADKVEELLKASEEGTIQSYINEVNLGEIFYITIRKLGLEPARRFLEQFTALAIERVLPSWEIIEVASQIKAEFAVSYADCFAAATAVKYDGVIVTGDPEFKKIEHKVKIDWI